jgi:hypothetical protein
VSTLCTNFHKQFQATVSAEWRYDSKPVANRRGSFGAKTRSSMIMVVRSNYLICVIHVAWQFSGK